MQQAWNSCARTSITSAIESTIGRDGDDKCVTFHLFGDGTKKMKQKNRKKKGKNKDQELRLDLPPTFDMQVHKVAALVNHFTSHRDDDAVDLYGDPVQYPPSAFELEHIKAALLQVVTDHTDSSNLSAAELYQEYILDGDLLCDYRGSDWAQWFTAQLERIRLESPPAVPSPSASKAGPSAGELKQQLEDEGVDDPAMLQFVEDLSALAGHPSSPRALIEQWMKVLTTCSSHWCPPLLWWCVAATLVGTNLDGMTRPCKESRVPVPSTVLTNWDMLSLLQLLQSNVFSPKVNVAARRVINYVRTDLAHERFDADWDRDCECMVELLKALGRPSAALKLLEFRDRQKHTTEAGEKTAVYMTC